jgi:tRNA threonylcarbamoyladenosine biosynthesis protein TsaB
VRPRASERRARATDAAPLLLAFETATTRSGVALLRGATLVAEVAAEPDRPAAETLLPVLEAVLARAGASESEVAAFAISIGPGSFTGLRVGLATVKGLAFGSGRPVVPVSTLAAIAAGAGVLDEPVAALLDARRGELYAAVYLPRGQDGSDRDGWEDSPLLDEGVYTVAELCERLPRPCALVGDGAVVHADALRSQLGRAARLLPEERGFARASHVGRLAVRRLARGLGLAAEEVIPRYLRRAEAEVNRTGLRFEAEEPRRPRKVL